MHILIACLVLSTLANTPDRVGHPQQPSATQRVARGVGWQVSAWNVSFSSPNEDPFFLNWPKNEWRLWLTILMPTRELRLLSKSHPGKHKSVEQLLASVNNLRLIKKLLIELGLGHDDCVARGDSLAALVLFESLTHTVVIEVRERVRQLARVASGVPDFWDAWLAGRKLPNLQQSP